MADVSGLRTPSAGETVRVISLNWYAPETRGEGPITLLWRLAGEWLPESLPVRYGPESPFAHAVGDDPAALEAARTTSGPHGVWFRCAALPALTGRASKPLRKTPATSRRVWWLSLDVLAEPFGDLARQERLQGLFVGLAEAAGADFAHAQVTDHTWQGSDHYVWPVHQSGREAQVQLHHRRDGFLGLPGVPVWWTWFGGVYEPLVAGKLARPPRAWRVSPAGGGTMVTLAERPATLKELPRSALSFGSDWFPAPLLSRIGATNESHPAKLRPPQ